MRVLIFLLMFFVALQSYAGSYQTNELTKLSDDISKHAGNQLEMLGTINPDSPQYQAASNLYDAAIRVQDRLDFLTQIGDIHSALVSAKDKELLSRYIKVDKSSYSKNCDSNLKYMNKSLPYITNSALLNESTVLRDKVSLSCEALRNF